MSDSWSLPARAGWIDWRDIKDQIPIEAVVERYAGPPAKVEGGRLLFRCPMPGHEDRNPSFSVEPASGRWRCWSRCGHGDAADLLAKMEGLNFPEATQRLAALFGLDGGPGIQTPAAPKPQAPPKPNPEPSPLDPVFRREGEALVAEAEKLLWEPKGGKALAHLRGRGLTDEAIRAARLGLIGLTPVPYKNRPGRYTTAGITIPWIIDGLLELLRIRRPPGSDPKYHASYWGRPSLYAPFGLRPGFPLVLVEGEFDAILLGWELRAVADVATLGSASGELSREARRALRRASRLIVATDGDRAARRPARRLMEAFPQAERVRPPAPDKDWGEVRAGGFGRLAYLWGRILPLGTPPRPEDFFNPAAYSLPPDERDRIEAMEERAAIQNEPRLSAAELAGHPREIGHPEIAERIEAEPETIEEPEIIQAEADDEAARLDQPIEPQPIKETPAAWPDFIGDRLAIGEGESASEGEVFRDWLAWSRSIVPDSQEAMEGFTAAMVATLAGRGLTARLDSLARRWIDLGLRPDPIEPIEGGSELETFDRLLSAAGFARVDPSELDRFAEFDPPAIDKPQAIAAPAASRARPRRSIAAGNASPHWFNREG